MPATSQSSVITQVTWIKTVSDDKTGCSVSPTTLPQAAPHQRDCYSGAQARLELLAAVYTIDHKTEGLRTVWDTAPDCLVLTDIPHGQGFPVGIQESTASTVQG